MTDDLVERLRAEDPETGLRLSIASEAADRIEYLERELEEEKKSRIVAAAKAWEFFERIANLETALRGIAFAKPECCEITNAMQGIARAALSKKYG